MLKLKYIIYIYIFTKEICIKSGNKFVIYNNYIVCFVYNFFFILSEIKLYN